ncbi:PHB depolymerase family esterase [Xylophilus sp. GOD-11R]|uniref:extracellular catalytic domain type 2 short-chain-length polyhydroxyalkanoate depolymerase n=1 Tax=Xylophilus sp. GOD-11R TaxID=3089814 RepID=UPI00298BFC43|nr:PHB depolymerase family esterase [Xylophilus sp. GOD-11R]WPB57819.1 PHB depolymerase family esterase [Xylophilus sp. GOD-11R]
MHLSKFQRKICTTSLWLFVLAGTSRLALAAADPLPRLGTDPGSNTVSGLSSGAFMAAQFSVAYSAEIAGAGIVAGGPFFCSGIGGSGAERFIANATGSCLNPVGPAPSGAEAWRQAQILSEEKAIDSLDHIHRQRIYIFTGAKDKIVNSRVVAEVKGFYAAAGLKDSQLKYVTHPDAGHSLVTSNTADLGCNANQSPNLNNCGFVQSQDILRWLYGDGLKSPSKNLGGKLVSFDQTEFIRAAMKDAKDPDRYIGLADTGQVYIPASCSAKNAKCKTHIVFHGCLQNEKTLGDRFYRTTGYNEMADSNGIVVIYPQTLTGPRNPQGCWDFWGYSSKDPVRPDYYTKAGPQMRAIDAMLRRVNANP